MPTEPGSGSFTAGLSGPVIFVVGLGLLLVSPLLWGGNRHVALILLEFLALVVMFFAAAQSLFASSAGLRSPARSVSPVSASALFLALSPVWVGIVQLLPLPSGLWTHLSGREVYWQALSAVQMQDAGLWRPLSLIPDVTWASVLAGLPIAAAFLLALLVSQRQLATLTRAVVFFALLQAILALMQASVLRHMSIESLAHGRAVGTFANPNHLANYIGMTLPLTVLMLRQSVLAAAMRKDSQSGPEGVRHRHGAKAQTRSWRALTPALWGAVLFVQLSALLATLSRAGVVTGLFVGLAAALLLPMREVTRSTWWRRAGGAALLLGLAAATVGVGGLLARLATTGDGNARWLMIKATWQAALTFWPVGAGLGTVPGVFPRFHPAGLSGYVEYAHSDFLQLLMECGLLFLVLGGVAVWRIVSGARALIRRLRVNPADQVLALQASCGLGVLAVLLHSWVEFNLRIPANAILAAFLFGAFIRPLGRKARGVTAAAVS